MSESSPLPPLLPHPSLAANRRREKKGKSGKMSNRWGVETWVECVPHVPSFNTHYSHKKRSKTSKTKKANKTSPYLFELLLGHGDADLHQVPNDLIHILAVESDLRELGRLHLDERCLGQLRNAAGNFRLD